MSQQQLVDPMVLLREISDEAYRLGISSAKVAIGRDAKKYAKNDLIWPELKTSSDEDEQEHYADINICNIVSGSWFEEFASSVSNSIQFPLNTCFLHGLAVIASAMTRQFRYNYHGEDCPVNLYVVTAQPPSTGKSGINNAFSNPVRIAYQDINTDNRKIRANLERRLAGLESELKKSANERQAMALTADIDKLQEEIDQYPNYVYATDDATPEALESTAFKQGGLFNIVSAESDAINVIMGNVYSDKKANHGIFLKGWDGEYHTPLRISRETGAGPVFGTLAVIAQDESISSILAAGLGGRGISERILMLRERNVLGSRNHAMYTPPDPVLKQEYKHLVTNLVRAENTMFSFTDVAMEFLTAYRCSVEKKLGDGGEYSHNMLRGAMGKADKQILKLACVLHAIEHFKRNGDMSAVVNEDSMITAIGIFKELSKTYIAAASSQGYAGEKVESEKMKSIFEMRASKNKFEFSVRALRDSIKNTLPFSQIPHLTSQLKDKILPSLEEDNYCVVVNGIVYLNPKIKK